MAQSREQASAGLWSEYQHRVLAELERLDYDIRDLERRVRQSEKDLVAQQIKSGVIGFLGGLVPVLIGIGLYLMQNGGVGR